MAAAAVAAAAMAGEAVAAAAAAAAAVAAVAAEAASSKNDWKELKNTGCPGNEAEVEKEEGIGMGKQQKSGLLVLYTTTDKQQLSSSIYT